MSLSCYSNLSECKGLLFRALPESRAESARRVALRSREVLRCRPAHAVGGAAADGVRAVHARGSGRRAAAARRGRPDAPAALPVGLCAVHGRPGGAAVLGRPGAGLHAGSLGNVRPVPGCLLRCGETPAPIRG